MDPEEERAALGRLEMQLLEVLQEMEALPGCRKTALAKTNIEQGLQWLQSRIFDWRALGLMADEPRVGRLDEIAVGVGPLRLAVPPVYDVTK